MSTPTTPFDGKHAPMTTTTLLSTHAVGDLYAEHLATLQTSYADALARTGFDALVIHSGFARKHSIFDDQYWTFKPSPMFAHWLSWRKPDAALLIRPGKPPTLLYGTAASFWDSQIEPEGAHMLPAFESVEVTSRDHFRTELPPGRIAFIGEDMASAANIGIDRDAFNPSELIAALDDIRTRKSPYERLCLGEANRRAAIGHQAVLDAFARQSLSELELHLLYLNATSQDDGDTPYKNIVALGQNAGVLHHVVYGRTPPARPCQSLLIDAGATCFGYASDITRTAVKGPGGDGMEVFAELVRRIERLQAEIIRQIRVGRAYEGLHDQAHHLLAPILRDLGLVKASDDELVQTGVTRCFLPHGLGHSLGIQVHDVGCRTVEPRPENPFLRNTRTIESGQVFTIEPGCYFIPAKLDELRRMPIAAAVDWDLVATLSRYGGVRIEDNIAISTSGTTNLTRDNWPVSP